MSGLTRDNKAQNDVISPKSTKIDLSRFIVNRTIAQTHTRTFHIPPRHGEVSKRIFGNGYSFGNKMQDTEILTILY